MKLARKVLAFVLTLAMLVPMFQNLSMTEVEAAELTPVGVHGQLRVNGTKIVDENGNPVQIRGISTHGINWDVGYPYVNEAAFKELRDNWGVNAVRLAMYTMEYNGYCNGGDQTSLKNLIHNGVTYATNLGMYAVIDWHILNDGNPNTNIESAKTFFNEMSAKYNNYNNVIYEICNEPNGCSWDDIKTYANAIIPIIRANDPDAIIIVGTPTWSQLGQAGHTNEVADSPLTGYSNIVYSLHFYCNESSHTQYLPAKVDYAMSKGLPVIVSEFGLSAANGSDGINTTQAEAWFDKLDGYGIGYFCWSLSNKNETSALIANWCSKTSGWSDSELSAAGQYIKSEYYSRREVLSGDSGNSGGSGSESTTVSVTGVTLNNSNVTLTSQGATTQLSATVLPSNATNKSVNWTSSNTSVATVSSNGLVTAVANGTTTITATTVDGNKTATCSVTVNISSGSGSESTTVSVTGVTLNKSNITLTSIGQTETLTATVLPSNATSPWTWWQSSDWNVASVNNGTVTAVGEGNAVITVTTTDGNKTATCNVTVKISSGAGGSNGSGDSSNTDNSTGSGNSGTASETDSQKQQVENFVRRMYTVALGREADESGLAFWANELLTGNRDGAAVAKGFILSSEMERLNLSNEEFVVRLYRTFFDRTPADGDSGKAFWINLLENGVSRAYVFRGFCHSAEFTTICSNYGITRGSITLTENRDKNADITMYVFRCYDRTLNRQPDTSGLNFWTGAIINGDRTPVDVAGNFVFSSEFKEKNLSNEEYIKVLYRMFFDREADTNGFNFWLTEMNSGRRDRYKVFYQFANSAEFKVVLAKFGL